MGRAGEAGSVIPSAPRRWVVDCSLGTALANLVPFSCAWPPAVVGGERTSPHGREGGRLLALEQILALLDLGREVRVVVACV